MREPKPDDLNARGRRGMARQYQRPSLRTDQNSMLRELHAECLLLSIPMTRRCCKANPLFYFPNPIILIPAFVGPTEHHPVMYRASSLHLERTRAISFRGHHRGRPAGCRFVRRLVHDDSISIPLGSRRVSFCPVTPGASCIHSDLIPAYSTVSLV